MAVKINGGTASKAKVEKKQSVAKVTKQEPDGALVESQEVISEDVFEGPVCNVGMSAGFTHNTGNFNNVKVQVSLFMPCKVEDIDGTFEFVKGWVDARLEAIQNGDEEEDTLPPAKPSAGKSTGAKATKAAPANYDDSDL